MNFNPVKHAQPDHPVSEHIAARYSPYSFEPLEVERGKLLSCLEAARWAPSSSNEQPWSFIIARREDEAEFERLISCLNEGNQGWTRSAGVLMITVARETFSRNGNPNRACEHDIGLAIANLTFQASELGLHVHQMAGVNLSKTRQVYGIPEGFHPVTAVAIGYAALPEEAGEEKWAERDRTPRTRKPLKDFVFKSTWGQSAF